jgi:citrate lyase subunit alpha/citrate CoA-transferase
MTNVKTMGRPRESRREAPQLLASIDSVFDAFNIKNGSTLSFHHHYRNGDRLLNAVCEIAAKRGLRGLTLAASAIFPTHAPIITYIRSGVIANIIIENIIQEITK